MERAGKDASKMRGGPAPTLPPGLALFWRAFCDLDSCRPHDQVLVIGSKLRHESARIPWTAVDQWCERHGVTGGLREDLEYHVGQLDLVMRDHRRRQVLS